MNNHEESKTYIKPEMTFIALESEGGLCASFDGSAEFDDDNYGYPD